MDKESTVYIHNGISLSFFLKEKVICRNMNGTREYYVKWNKPGIKKNMFSFTWISLKKVDFIEVESKRVSLRISKGRGVEIEDWIRISKYY